MMSSLSDSHSTRAETSKTRPVTSMAMTLTGMATVRPVRMAVLMISVSCREERRVGSVSCLRPPALPGPQPRPPAPGCPHPADACPWKDTGTHAQTDASAQPHVSSLMLCSRGLPWVPSGSPPLCCQKAMLPQFRTVFSTSLMLIQTQNNIQHICLALPRSPRLAPLPPGHSRCPWAGPRQSFQCTLPKTCCFFE